jgi:hypothetical protein
MPVASSAFHWQPVRSRKKIASMHRRSSARGRPPLRGSRGGGSGSSGSIRSHIASDKQKRLAIDEVAPILGLLS